MREGPRRKEGQPCPPAMASSAKGSPRSLRGLETRHKSSQLFRVVCVGREGSVKGMGCGVCTGVG